MQKMGLSCILIHWLPQKLFLFSHVAILHVYHECLYLWQSESSTLVICLRLVAEGQNMTESPLSPAPASEPEPEPVSPAPGPGAAERALQWHFLQLDVDGDGTLSEREARPLRQYLRRTLKPRRCAKKFTQYCDQDRNAALSLLELNTCLGL